MNVGFNPKATVDSGKRQSFYWFAGELQVVPTRDAQGNRTGYRVDEIPVEYGATNLVPADMMIQPQFGMVGALIVEPQDSSWIEDRGTQPRPSVRPRQGRPFRDFVIVAQNVVANLTNPDRWGSINYRTSRSTPGLPTISSSTTGRPRSSTPSPPTRGPMPSRCSRSRPAARCRSSSREPSSSSPTTPAARSPPRTSGGRHPGSGRDPGADDGPPWAWPAGTTLKFFCSQHGPAMDGSLVVQALGGAAATIEIDGMIVGGKPTWVVNNDSTKPASNVPVKPGDTVIWKAVSGTHGIVFDPTERGAGYQWRSPMPSSCPARTPPHRSSGRRRDSRRFRLVMPSTSTNNAVVPPVTFDIHGHGWPEEPFAKDPMNPQGLIIGKNDRSDFLGCSRRRPTSRSTS